MNEEIERLRAQLGQMKADLAEQSLHQKQTAIRAEMRRQQPGASDVLEDLAVANLSAADGSPDSLVGVFLRKDSIQEFIGAKKATEQQQQQQKTAPKSRPPLSEMLGEIKAGKASLRFTRS